MAKLSINSPPGVPVSEIQSYRPHGPQNTLSMMHRTIHLKGDNSDQTSDFLCCSCLMCFKQSGDYNMRSCGICCSIFGCTIGWNKWAKFCFPTICCFMPEVSCGKECGTGLKCCGNGCFLGTQSKTMSCCLLQYGNRNIDN